MTKLVECWRCRGSGELKPSLPSSARRQIAMRERVPFQERRNLCPQCGGAGCVAEPSPPQAPDLAHAGSRAERARRGREEWGHAAPVPGSIDERVVGGFEPAVHTSVRQREGE